jgi:hypothetical protein
MQLDFLRNICETLDEEHQNIQSQVLRVLVSKLETAISQIERVQRKKKGKDNVAGIKRWKYVLVKEYLDKAIQDLEAWQKTFDPSWFLIMKVGSQLIDQELSKEDRTKDPSIYTAKELRDSLKEEPQIKTSIFLPEDGLASAKRQIIPSSTAQTVQRSPSSKQLILDPVPCDPQADISILTKDIRDLARKLSRADPLTFGLLNCRGVVKVTDPTDPAKKKISSFNFVFNIPWGLENPRSLRSTLNHNPAAADGKYSLSDRFRIAQQLATSVSYIHTYGFVHKGIRPETILIFQDHKSPLGASFLLGFEKFRLADGRTLRVGDCVWEKDLYRHPSRQGLKLEEDYTMQHDIYSLGVCLLEIGLWKSFVIYHDDDKGDGGSPMPSTLLLPIMGNNIGENGDGDDNEDEIKKASIIKEYLVQLAKQHLPSHMGDRYTEIVITCLTCLDETNPDFGDATEFEDVDGVLIGVRYIEKVRFTMVDFGDISYILKQDRFCCNSRGYRFDSP